MECPNCGGDSVRTLRPIADLFKLHKRDAAHTAYLCRDCGYRWNAGEAAGMSLYGTDLPIVLSSHPPVYPGYGETPDAVQPDAVQPDAPAAASAPSRVLRSSVNRPVPSFRLQRPESGNLWNHPSRSAFSAGKTAAPSAETQEDGTVVCRSCGCGILPNSRFCSKCGAKQ